MASDSNMDDFRSIYDRAELDTDVSYLKKIIPETASPPPVPNAWSWGEKHLCCCWLLSIYSRTLDLRPHFTQRELNLCLQLICCCLVDWSINVWKPINSKYSLYIQMLHFHGINDYLNNFRISEVPNVPIWTLYIMTRTRIPTRWPSCTVTRNRLSSSRMLRLDLLENFMK